MVCFCCFFKQKTAYEMRISDWSSDVCSSDLQFFKLHHARLDTEPYAGKFPRIWVGASGPRMLDIAGRYADGWWPAGAWTPEDFAAKTGALRQSAARAGRDPLAIVPAYIQICFLGDDAELAKILEAPLIKSLIMQFPGDQIGRAHV